MNKTAKKGPVPGPKMSPFFCPLPHSFRQASHGPKSGHFLHEPKKMGPFFDFSELKKGVTFTQNEKNGPFF